MVLRFALMGVIPMRYKTLGNTKVKISAIGQGTSGYLPQGKEQEVNQIRALDLGIGLGMTFIDTAESYGEGYAEKLIGKVIKGIRGKVFIATKFSPEHNSYSDVRKSCEASLKRLKTDYIDLYQLYWSNPRILISETMGTLEKLKKEGKIRFIGVSNLSVNGLREVQAVIAKGGIKSLQTEYNLFDRTIEKTVLPYCEKQKITTIAYSPLDQGLIADGDKRIKVLKNIADRYDKTVAQIVLKWLIHHSSVIAIPKAIELAHVRQNALCADFVLSDEDYEKINKVFTPTYALVPPDKIRVIKGGQDNRQVYKTLEEAIENKLGFVPSPAELAEDIRMGEILKPVKVVKIVDWEGKYDYDLVEGRVRYWAMVIAGEKTIPILIRGG